MLSSNPQLWVSADTHYTLPLAPVLAMAAAAGLANVAGLVPSEHRRRAVAVVAVSMLVLGVAFNALAAKTPSRIETYASQRPFAASAARALDRVPAHASVASQEILYPRLSARDTADVIRRGMVPRRLHRRRDLRHPRGGAAQRELARGRRCPARPAARLRPRVLRPRLGRAAPQRGGGLGAGTCSSPFPPTEAARLRVAAVDWAAAAAAYGARLDSPTAKTTFRQAQASLAELLRRAGERTEGGCGEMAGERAGARRRSWPRCSTRGGGCRAGRRG